MSTVLSELTSIPQTFPDTCASVSRPLILALTTRLPTPPDLVLSVGCGSGLLEAMLLQATGGHLNLLGVEVPSCVNKHLPAANFVQVAGTTSIHADATVASTLMFVYPRQPSLVARYLQICVGRTLQQTIWFGHRNDWPEVEPLLRAHFSTLELIEGPGVAEYELLAIATEPQPALLRQDSL